MQDGVRRGSPGADAGEFSSWLAGMQSAFRGEAAADVPCNGCTACCTSSQFVHIAPDETQTLARIPRDLLFPAPGLPRGHVVLGYDDRGHCPMLVDGHCSIYEVRPRTCRTYDCRIFAATDVDTDDTPLIADRARRWRFRFAGPDARTQREAVRAAARFLDEHGDELASAGRTATQRAVLAIEVHDVFLHWNASTGRPELVEPGPEVVRAEVLRHTGATDEQ